MSSKIKVLFPCLEYKDWPTETEALCLYCSEGILGTPLPKVNFYNVKNDLFHIQGFFCRPCCALAHIKETSFGGECDRSYIWTQVFLKRYFGLNDFHCAPPKTSMKKYGGMLTLEEFYGKEHDFIYCGNIEGPFVNAYQILEFTKFDKLVENSKDNEMDEITRPKMRTEPMAEFQETGFPPMLIDYLSKTQEKKVIEKKEEDKKEIKQNSESLFKFMKK